MIEPADRTCGTCAYAEPTVGDDGRPFVECRRFPPQVFALDDEPSQSWPTIQESDWCGEWAEAG